MAWPPPVLPVNRTNATPQLDLHAADHNAANQAINDIVTKVSAVATGAVVYNASAVIPVTASAIAGTRDLGSFVAGLTFTYPTVVQATMLQYGGGAPGDCSFGGDLANLYNSTIFGNNGAKVYAVATYYGFVCVSGSWSVPAGGNCGWKARQTIYGTGGGSVNASGTANTVIIAQ